MGYRNGGKRERNVFLTFSILLLETTCSLLFFKLDFQAQMEKQRWPFNSSLLSPLLCEKKIFPCVQEKISIAFGCISPLNTIIYPEPLCVVDCKKISSPLHFRFVRASEVLQVQLSVNAVEAIGLLV